MATETRKKVAWDNIVKQMAADKKRIDASLENPQENQAHGITFVKPASVRAVRGK